MFNQLLFTLDRLSNENRVHLQIVGGLALIVVAMVTVCFWIELRNLELIHSRAEKGMCYKRNKHVKKNIIYFSYINIVIEKVLYYSFLYSLSRSKAKVLKIDTLFRKKRKKERNKEWGKCSQSYPIKGVWAHYYSILIGWIVMNNRFFISFCFLIFWLFFLWYTVTINFLSRL